MVTTITSSIVGDTTTPTLVLGWDSRRRGGSIVHQIIGSSSVDVTLRPASPRSGTLELFYLTRATALACEAMHAKAARFTLVDTDLPEIGMQYAVTDALGVKLDEATRTRWVVSIGFEQIA